jgi:hypothetical protein
MKRTILALAVVVGCLGVTTSASAAPGTDIKSACGATFGQLISAARSTGTAVHSNYAGGAHAFADSAILVAHGCTA